MSDYVSDSQIDVSGVIEAEPSGPTSVNAPQPDSNHNDGPMDQEEDSASPNDNYKYELARLKSYPEVWPSNYFKKADCAKNGFYYRNTSELRCFSCDLQLPPINPEDVDLAAKHATLSPLCEFTTNPADAQNKPIPVPLNYNRELHRLITFLRTSWDAPVDLNDLAKWGFYFTGSGDVGRCFICRLEVRGWERNDKGESEHRKWNPQCPFIQNREVGNVPIGDEGTLYPDATMALANNTALVPVQGSEIVCPDDISNIIDLTQARYTQYAQRADRLQTYNMWPMSISQRPEQLADAGFYYTGRGDRVICFYCGGGLKDWGDGDYPWVEHAAWFANCDFVKIIKGTPFIIQAQSSRAARSASEVQQFNHSSVDIEPHEPAPVDQALNTPRLALERGGDEANASSDLDDLTKQLRLCKVCFEKELGIVFLPCGHMATCPDCAPQLTACPICRTKASAYVRAYLP